VTTHHDESSAQVFEAPACSSPVRSSSLLSQFGTTFPHHAKATAAAGTSGVLRLVLASATRMAPQQAAMLSSFILGTSDGASSGCILAPGCAERLDWYPARFPSQQDDAETAASRRCPKRS
jgi:hypothetical protein